MITDLIEYLNHLSTNSPFIGNTITLMITGAIGVAVWKLPLKIYNIIKRHVVIEYSVANTGNNALTSPYGMIVAWYLRHEGWKYSKSRAHQYTRGCQANYGIGSGKHYFKYNNRFYLLRIDDLASTGSDYQKRELTIKTLGLNLETIDNLVAHIKKESDLSLKDRRRLFNYTPSGDYEDSTYNVDRPLSSITVDEEVKHKVFDRIKVFRESESWYREVGIPYKLGIILHGYTGTGKTSIIKAISTEFNLNIHYIPLYAMSEEGLVRALNGISPRSMIVLEDFDTSNAVKKRKGVATNVLETSRLTKVGESEDSVTPNPSSFLEDMIGLNLSALLNLLDGIAELHNVLIVATTNDMSNIDPAVMRPGRFDVVVEVKPLNKELILEYTNKVYGVSLTDLDIIDNIPVPAANLQGMFLEHKDDIDSYIKSINCYQQEQLDNFKG